MSAQMSGWMMFAAAVGMMLGLIAVDVSTLQDWHEATTPAFIGGALGHLAVVLAAFVGGKLIPTV